MKLRTTSLAAAAIVAAGLLASPAHANLVPLGLNLMSGQGIGAVTTVLTLQEGPNSTESGYVGFNGDVFGSASSGFSQSRTFTFADLSITNASQLGLVVNLAEPGSENPPSVLATNAGSIALAANFITLSVYSSTGTLLQTHSLAGPLTLTQVAGGVGGSGLLFGLDAAEQAQVNGAGSGLVFAVGATFAQSGGGNDVIQATRITAPVPEPETYALLLAGLGVVGFMARRRKSQA